MPKDVTHWSKNKPTKAGWYWWRTCAVTTHQFRWMGLVQIDDDGYCRQEGEYVTHLGGEWAGPLEPPKENK